MEKSNFQKIIPYSIITVFIKLKVSKTKQDILWGIYTYFVKLFKNKWKWSTYTQIDRLVFTFGDEAWE